ncbi:hypothetical protein EJ04DRAFT_440775 [Polyplosphaeria fusca]|uniref:TMEM205-like domain-containing protein n=1 Tax=Polyplosphaeria fusca TaxID=682080 RepID=A0A9P4QWY4_9PLEO|nr:hypothetical protein EJ04DRAFT_440775 [Polyplosphaeria fusca]
MAFADFLLSLGSYLPGLASLHLLAYSTLLGTELYQTFVVTTVAHQTLPRSAFTTLQKRLFPTYFRAQALLLIVTAATLPPYGPLSLVKKKKTWIPFAVATLTAGLNLLVYGPRTSAIMVQRIHQETTDGRKSSDLENMSADMRTLNRAFSRTHAMSIHLNLISIGAMLWHGWSLASKMKF